jgi:hypothetical protein
MLTSFQKADRGTLASGTKYIYLHKHLIAETSAAGTQYDHTDGLGSPVAWADSAGGVSGAPAMNRMGRQRRAPCRASALRVT